MLPWRAGVGCLDTTMLRYDVMLVGVACTTCSAITPEHNERSRRHTCVSTPGAGTTLGRGAGIEASPRISGLSGGRLVWFKRRHTSGLGPGSVGLVPSGHLGIGDGCKGLESVNDRFCETVWDRALFLH